MVDPRIHQAIIETQDEIELQTLILDLVNFDQWKALVKHVRKRHDRHLVALTHRGIELDEVRYLQGRIKELTSIVLAPEVARTKLDRMVKDLESLRKKAQPVDSPSSDGIFNPDDKAIEDYLKERNQ